LDSLGPPTVSLHDVGVELFDVFVNLSPYALFSVVPRSLLVLHSFILVSFLQIILSKFPDPLALQNRNARIADLIGGELEVWIAMESAWTIQFGRSMSPMATGSKLKLSKV